MAANNYFGFTPNPTSYAAAANAATGYQTSQGAYGVTSTPGVVNASSAYTNQRTPTGYDTAAAYQATAVPPASYGAALTTPSFDYAAAAYGRVTATNAGVTYDSTKTYYQQAAAAAQSVAQSTGGISPHVVAAAAANSGVSAASVSSDLQNWTTQNYSTRQTTSAVAAAKAVYNTNYSVPVTRQLSVPPITQKVQATTPSSYLSPQYQQQSQTSQHQTLQSATALGSISSYQLPNSQAQTSHHAKVANVGTIGQQKKIYSPQQQQQPVASMSSTGGNMPVNYSSGVSSSVVPTSQITATAVGYSASPVSTYATAYPVNTVHNVANVAAKQQQQQKAGGASLNAPTAAAAAAATSQTSTSYTPYDTAILNAAYYMNQGSATVRPKINNAASSGVGGGSHYKARPGFGSTTAGNKPFRARIPPKPQQLHYCDACKISCAGPGAYHDHLQGQKHKKKVAKAKSESSKSQGGPIFICELCDIECTAADAYAAHLRGAKHTKVVKLHTKLGKPIPPIDPKAAAAIAALNQQEEASSSNATNVSSSAASAAGAKDQRGASIKCLSNRTLVDSNKENAENKNDENKEGEIFVDDRPAVGMEYIDEEKDAEGKLINFVCKLCDCKFSDPNAKEMHMKGRKHRLAFKKKVDPELKVEVKSNNYKSKRERFTKNRARKNKFKERSEKTDAKGGAADDSTVAKPVPARKTKGARMLAVESEQDHRMWEKEYRRYEENVKEYREYCRMIGTAAVPPPAAAALPGMISLMRGAHPLIPPGTGIRMHHQPNPPQPPPFLVGPGHQMVRESIEDRHINYKHKEINLSDFEWRYLNKVVNPVEKAVRAISDILADNSEDKKSENNVSENSTTAPDASKDNANAETNEKKKSDRVLVGLHRVGDLAKTTLLKGTNYIELVLMCSEKPTVTLLNQVASHLPDQLKNVTDVTYTVTPNPTNASITIESSTTAAGDQSKIITIEMAITSPVVREELLNAENNTGDGSNNVTTDVTLDHPADLLDKAKCLDALAAVRHAKWFQARAIGLHNCLPIIRILKDLCRRVPTWAPFNSWLMELLVEAVIGSSPTPLTPGDALRRVLEAISSGILLPDGPGIQDPCEKDPVNAACKLKLQEREDITASAQHALRMLAFSQIHKILGIEKLPVPTNKFKTGGGRDFANRKRRRENSAGSKTEAIDGKKEKKDDDHTAAADGTVKMETSDSHDEK